MFARLVVVVFLSVAVLQAQAPRARKIFISVDLEGITGVVQPAQLGPEGFEYQRAREWMTAEVNAAIAGVRAAAPAEIVTDHQAAAGADEPRAAMTTNPEGTAESAQIAENRCFSAPSACSAVERDTR
jgi:hypothetical protein